MNISPVQGAERPLSVSTQPTVTPVQTATEPTDPYKQYYYSPALTIDPATGTDVLQIRDANTGAVTAQYPSEKDLKAYEQKSLKPDTPLSTETGSAAKTVDVQSVAAIAPATPTIAAVTAQATITPETVSSETALSATPLPKASIVV